MSDFGWFYKFTYRTGHEESRGGVEELQKKHFLWVILNTLVMVCYIVWSLLSCDFMFNFNILFHFTYVFV